MPWSPKEVEKLEATVIAALEHAGHVGGDNLLVVAVSGGPDSMALLHALLRLRERAGPRLHVAHLDHNFREEAHEDAQFTATAACRLGLPVTIEKAAPVSYQREMGISSFEEAAREVRYIFLARVARDLGAAAIALGHTADDLAETVLMHILRGSGIHGLRGMEQLSTWRSRTGGHEAVLFRPILGVTKGETESYCNKLGIAFREDPGNRLLRFTRNRVRHHLLPALEEYNPRIRQALIRLAQSASLEVGYLEEEVTRLWNASARQEGDSISLDAHQLALIHPFMQRMVLRRAYRQLTGDTRRLGEVHLRAMADFIGSPPGKALGLPRGLRLHSGYRQLILSRNREPECPFPPLTGQHALQSPDSEEETSTRIPGWQVTIQRLSSPSDLPNEPFAACFDREALGDSLLVRTWQPGDRFQPLGMEGAKKLQDFFVDGKVLRAWRHRIPLLVTERGILWVVGYRVAEWGRVRQGSRQVCRICFSPLGA